MSTGLNGPPIRTGGQEPRHHQPVGAEPATHTSPAARRAAWAAYLAVTGALLSAVRDPAAHPKALDTRLGAAARHVVRSAPLWEEDGPMLISAVHAAVGMCHADARADLTRGIADRLYVLSAGPPRARTAPRNRAAW
ncbi:hypothetical protein [Dactylosporangium sp. NPDC000521]|uniref:hypothetical protein n=1 Tax=Dactylosporangium sp. NPDC000521 TaxID=3363975 RepID=UPI00367AF1DA